MSIWERLRTYVGIVILVGAMGYAIVRVVYNQLNYEAPDVTTIRICHWQLEAGFRDALQDLINDYQKQYAATHNGQKIRIVQCPVSERGYPEYVNTGLIGGTAPDIIEKGKATTASDPAYVARFFLPISTFVDEPNPYNAGTPMADLPWRETFFDGMQGAYDRTLLDYYYIPFSMFTMRIFYNVDLYQKITGKTEPPKTYAEFLTACREIREYASKTGSRLVPIAGSTYQGNVFRWNYESPFLADLIPKADTNYDGKADTMESYLAYKEGLWSFTSPRLVDSWKCMTTVASNFQDGWLAAQRDDATFLFVQGNAVMTASGSWDAPSIKKQVGGLFRLGICDFPLPTDDPEFGKYVRGPASEASINGGIPWAINRQSRHADICIDFLRFCTTRKNNEKFNLAITWLPVVRGAKLSPDLIPFRPRIEGFAGAFDYSLGTQVSLKINGNRWPLYSGRMTPEEFAKEATEVYDRCAAEGFQEEVEKSQRNCRNLERITAAMLLQKHFAPSGNAAKDEQKLEQVLQSSVEFEYNLAQRRQEFADVNSSKAGK